MAFIDMVEWKPQSNDVFAWMFPESNLSTATQLVVRESQEAFFFSKGQIIAKFGPGKHKLSTENIPLLRNLFGIPFGGKNPFTAEVWFVNKAAPLTIDWKTTSMRFMDPDYGQMIPLTAAGRYGLKVIEAEKFLIQLVGTLRQFTSNELTDHFMGPLIAKTNSSIVSFMTANSVGINTIAAHLDNLSKFIGQPMAEFWEPYGFSLTGFYITSVDLDTSTPDGKKIAEALSDRSAQGIAGYTWQQKQSFGMANNAVDKVSSANSGMGIMGVAMMANAFGGGGGMGSAMMQTPNSNQYATGNSGGSASINARAEVFCSNCAKKYPVTSNFCPFCGDQYNPCPACGADNSSSAKRCVSCGTQLLAESSTVGGNACSKCGTAVQPGIRFCPTCGNKLM
ncbi:MAG TPA: SPFH domain-containing protein [Treponemataceae bacterium]|nr:SPFH domain-containing protein [Treponemataceae bacterium]